MDQIESNDDFLLLEAKIVWCFHLFSSFYGKLNNKIECAEGLKLIDFTRLEITYSVFCNVVPDV